MSNGDNEDVQNIPNMNFLRYIVVGSNEEEESDENVDNRPRFEILNEVSPMSMMLAERAIESASASSPVEGESFCDCFGGSSDVINCKCGEEDNHYDWVWDTNNKSQATQLNQDNREVMFHVEYSCGTAAARGSLPMGCKQHYWEIKMVTPVYGTDMMVGVGTSHVNLDQHRYTFVSLLGSDSESWGLSYTGKLYHRGENRQFGPRFGQGSIIGIHLDMWNGTLSFFKNRQPLGVAYTGLQGKVLYPMVSSTAARSGMKVVKSRSFASSLQFICCRKLREMIPANESVLDVVNLPPGLKAFLENNLSWLLGPRSERHPKSTRTNTDGASSSRKRRHSSSNKSAETFGSKISKSSN